MWDLSLVIPGISIFIFFQRFQSQMCFNSRPLEPRHTWEWVRGAPAGRAAPPDPWREKQHREPKVINPTCYKKIRTLPERHRKGGISPRFFLLTANTQTPLPRANILLQLHSRGGSFRELGGKGGPLSPAQKPRPGTEVWHRTRGRWHTRILGIAWGERDGLEKSWKNS